MFRRASPAILGIFFKKNEMDTPIDRLLRLYEFWGEYKIEENVDYSAIEFVDKCEKRLDIINQQIQSGALEAGISFSESAKVWEMYLKDRKQLKLIRNVIGGYCILQAERNILIDKLGGIDQYKEMLGLM